MHVIFVSPHFPNNQKQFVRALKEVGAGVTGIGETPFDYLPDDVKHWLDGYEQVGSVTNEAQMIDATRRIQGRGWVDRLEATIESHMLTAARVREVCTIPGISYEQTLICRDKTLMKDFMRENDISCAQSAAVDSVDAVKQFVAQEGYPVILKPRDGAGAAKTWKVSNNAELELAMEDTGVTKGYSVAIEEFVEGHEGFYDTFTVGGKVIHEFVNHYYPNVLEAMRTRWISPVIITSNRINDPSYNELRAMGHKVIERLGLHTAPTHMEWFFGPKGLKFSEIGARPPGVGQWDLYCVANDIDLYKEWATAICYGTCSGTLSRNYSSAIIALRPNCDGNIHGYNGIDEINHKYGGWVTACHFPPAGSPTQPVEAGYMANAWIQIKHPDYDELRNMLTDIGETIQVKAG